MKRSLFTILAVVALVALPQLIPNVQMTPTDQMQIAEQTTPTIANTAGIATNTASTQNSFEISAAGMTVTISPGGQAIAWNLLAELCNMGWDDMCDLYNHGVIEGWWI